MRRLFNKITGMFDIVIDMLYWGIFFSIIGLVAGAFGALHVVFDSISNFRWHLSLALLIAVPVSYVLGARRAAMVALIGGVCGTWFSMAGLPVGYSPSTGDANARAISNEYRLLTHNLLYNNDRGQETLALIRASKADFLFLQEYADHWPQTLKPLEAEYPYKAHCDHGRVNRSTVIFSKLALLNVETICGPGGSFVQQKVRIGKAELTLGAVHLSWPWPYRGPAQITALEPKLKALKALNGNVLVGGDFNSARWSWSVKRFAKAGGLKIITGLGATWLPRYASSKLTMWLGLPLDHVMFAGKIKITATRNLGPAGSDHRPLLVSFRLVD